MKILITTGNGKVGEELVKQLLEKKVPLRVGAHTVDKAKAKFPGAEVVKFDYADAASQTAAVEGVDTVYLAAPGDFPAEPEKAFIDRAKKAGVKKLVKLSASGVEHAPDAVPLRAVEKYVQASGIPYTILRPSWFMQNFVTMHLGSIRSGSFAESAADAKTAFIDTRDIAAVAVKALTEPGHDGKEYTLTGPAALSRSEVAQKISAVTGKQVGYTALSDEQFREAMKPYLKESYIGLLSALYEAVRAGHTAPVSGEVKRLLGRDPISFDQFAKDHRGAWA